jgi:hypothetical protein
MSTIIGGHTIISSTDPEADRIFFRDVLRFANVDAGDGWLIFGLPEAEFAIHPAEENDNHEFYLLSDNLNAFMKAMDEQEVEYSPVHTFPWGVLTQITLPGGGKVGVYEPKHKRPKATSTKKKAAKKSKAKPKAVNKRSRKPVQKSSLKAAKKKSRRK